MEFPVLFEKGADAGGYVISCPMLRGCVFQVETEEEAFENIKETIQAYLASIQDFKRMNNLRPFKKVGFSILRKGNHISMTDGRNFVMIQ